MSIIFILNVVTSTSISWNYSFLYIISHRTFMFTSLTVPYAFHSLRLTFISFLGFKCTTVIHYFITFSASLFLNLLLPFLCDQIQAMFVKCVKILYIVPECHIILSTRMCMKLAFPFFMCKSINNIKTKQAFVIDKWSSSWYLYSCIQQQGFTCPLTVNLRPQLASPRDLHITRHSMRIQT
jgi:hypothetical protein